MVVTHYEQSLRLLEELPAATLLLGPASVGKTSMALQAARYHGAIKSDVTYVQRLTMDVARTTAYVSRTAPEGKIRVPVVQLDGSTKAAQVVLLKAVEEAPPTTRFMLIASVRPSAPLESRCEVILFNLLSDEEVEKILLGRNFNPTDAHRLAKLAGGQVKTALDAAGRTQKTKLDVLVAINNIKERSEDALEASAGRWTDEHTSLLTVACHEYLTKRWRVFQEAELEGLLMKRALQILTALRTDTRPRLVVTHGLMSVLKGAS